MVSSIGSLVVDERGTVRLASGLSGINIADTVSQLVAAKRLPIDRLETRSTTQQAQIAELKNLRSTLTTLQNTTDKLRGVLRAQDAGNIFRAKTSFVSTSRPGGSGTASAAGNLIGITTANNASAGSFEVELLRTAKAHRVSSSTYASQTSSLSLTGDFKIFGRKVSVNSGDDLQDIAAKINAANSGTVDDESAFVTKSFASSSTALNYSGIITVNGIDVTVNTTDTLTNISNNINALAGVTSTVETQDDGTFRIRFTEDTLEPFTVSSTVTNQSVSYSTGFSSKTTALGLSGTITVNGDNVNIVTTDTLEDISNKIGALTDISSTIEFANSSYRIKTSHVTLSTLSFTGTTIAFSPETPEIDNDTLPPSGVSATVVKVSATQFYLSLRNTDTNELIEVTDNDDVLKDLGVLTAGSAFQFVSQEPIAARIGLVGDTDLQRFESKKFSDPTVDLGIAGDITINGTLVTGILATDSLNDIRDKLNAAGIANFNASVFADENGYRLEMETSGSTNLTVTGNTLTGLELDNMRVVERDSNLVDDIFSGVTMRLFAAEEGTAIKIDVEPDSNNIKQAIVDFVTAYNAAQEYINAQNEIDPDTGNYAETAVLYDSPALRSSQTLLFQKISSTVAGVGANFAGLSNIGITFVDNAEQATSLTYNTLEIDDTVLDEALLNNLTDIENLFAFKGTSSDPRLEILNWSSDTKAITAPLDIDITHNGTSITAMTINGVATGFTYSGNRIEITDGNAKGLVMIYSGTTSASDISVNYTNGVANQFYAELEKFTTTQRITYFDGANVVSAAVGVLEGEIESLTSVNSQLETRINRELERLELYRERILAQYVRMEAAVSEMQGLLDNFDQLSASLTGKK